MSKPLGQRAHGEGGISRRSGGKQGGSVGTQWQGAVYLGKDSTGKRIRKTFYGRTAADVAAKLKAAKAAADGSPVVTKQSVSEYLTAWLGAKSFKSAQTRRQYEYIVRRHLIEVLGDKQLVSLSVTDVERMLANCAKTRTPSTCGHLRAVLRTALNRAIKLGLLTRNVAALAEAPVQVSTERDRVILSPAHSRRLFESMAGNRLLALYVTALNTGARQGELLGLLWSDIDFSRSRVSITKSLQRVRGELVLCEPKSTHSRRSVPMSASVATALVAHRERQEVEREAAGTRWDTNHDYVFRTESGQGHDGVQVTKEFQALVKAAGLPRMRFHDLRHSYITLMLAAGVEVGLVSRRAGHSSTTLTWNTYGHAAPDQDAGADASVMERLLAC